MAGAARQRFVVELQRSEESYGLDLSAAGRICLVNQVKDGLLGAWNQQRAPGQLKLERFDRIFAVNGEEFPYGSEMLAKLRSSTGSVSIVVERPTRRSVHVRKNGQQELGIRSWAMHFTPF